AGGSAGHAAQRVPGRDCGSLHARAAGADPRAVSRHRGNGPDRRQSRELSAVRGAIHACADAAWVSGCDEAAGGVERGHRDEAGAGLSASWDVRMMAESSHSPEAAICPGAVCTVAVRGELLIDLNALLLCARCAQVHPMPERYSGPSLRYF